MATGSDYIVNLRLTKPEAIELEYAIRFRLDSLYIPSSGCNKCIREECQLHAPMIERLLQIFNRLVADEN